MKVLIVDDHRVISHAIANLLHGLMNGLMVLEADCGQAALSGYAQSRPDVVLLEVDLPDISGLEVARRLKQRWRHARILFFSRHDELPIVRQALDIGGLGFVSKHCTPEELVEAVKRVGADQPYIEHPIATRLAMNHERAVDHRMRDMTQRELEVLRLYARGETIPGIARRLCVSNKTVSNHLALLKNKLQVATTIELVHLAADAGLVRYGRPCAQQPA